MTTLTSRQEVLGIDDDIHSTEILGENSDLNDILRMESEKATDIDQTELNLLNPPEINDDDTALKDELENDPNLDEDPNNEETSELSKQEEAAHLKYTLANYLFENNIFKTIDKNVIDSHEDKGSVLEHAIEQEVENRIQAGFKKRFSKWDDEEVKGLVETVNNGGSVRDFVNFYGTRIDYDKLNLKDKTVQEKLIRDNLNQQQWSDEAIDGMIGMLKDTDGLEPQAKEAQRQLGERKRFEEQQFQEELQYRQQEEAAQSKRFLNDLDAYVQSNDEIGNVYFTQSDKEMVKYLTDYQPVYYDEAHTKPVIDPQTNQPKMMNTVEFKLAHAAPEQKLAYQALMYKFILNDFKLDGQEVPLRNKVVKNVESDLFSQTRKIVGTSRSTSSNGNYRSTAEAELSKSLNAFQKNKNK